MILFIMITNNTAHIINHTEKKNRESSTYPSCTQETAANIFPTIGKNHRGFIDLISIGWRIHLLKIIIVNIDWIATQEIQNQFAIP